MELQVESKRRFHIEKLEERIAPALSISVGATSVSAGVAANASVGGLVSVSAGVSASASIGAVSVSL